jgi:hypothetical protein
MNKPSIAVAIPLASAAVNRLRHTFVFLTAFAAVVYPAQYLEWFVLKALLTWTNSVCASANTQGFYVPLFAGHHTLQYPIWLSAIITFLSAAVAFGPTVWLALSVADNLRFKNMGGITTRLWRSACRDAPARSSVTFHARGAWLFRWPRFTAPALFCLTLVVSREFLIPILEEAILGAALAAGCGYCEASTAVSYGWPFTGASQLDGWYNQLYYHAPALASYIPPLVTAWVAFQWLTHNVAPLDGYERCAHCSYMLRGLSERRCPECGNAF